MVTIGFLGTKEILLIKNPPDGRRIFRFEDKSISKLIFYPALFAHLFARLYDLLYAKRL